MEFVVRFFNLDDHEVDDYKPIPLWEERCWVKYKDNILTIGRPEKPEIGIVVSNFCIEPDEILHPQDCMLFWGFLDTSKTIDKVWKRVVVELSNPSKKKGRQEKLSHTFNQGER